MYCATHSLKFMIQYKSYRGQAKIWLCFNCERKLSWVHESHEATLKKKSLCSIEFI